MFTDEYKMEHACP